MASSAAKSLPPTAGRKSAHGKACAPCHKKKAKCDGERPCKNCLKEHDLSSADRVDASEIGCVDRPASKPGPKTGDAARNKWEAEAMLVAAEAVRLLASGSVGSDDMMGTLLHDGGADGNAVNEFIKGLTGLAALRDLCKENEELRSKHADKVGEFFAYSPDRQREVLGEQEQPIANQLRSIVFEALVTRQLAAKQVSCRSSQKSRRNGKHVMTQREEFDVYEKWCETGGVEPLKFSEWKKVHMTAPSLLQTVVEERRGRDYWAEEEAYAGKKPTDFWGGDEKRPFEGSYRAMIGRQERDKAKRKDEIQRLHDEEKTAGAKALTQNQTIRMGIDIMSSISRANPSGGTADDLQTNMSALALRDGDDADGADGPRDAGAPGWADV